MMITTLDQPARNDTGFWNADIYGSNRASLLVSRLPCVLRLILGFIFIPFYTPSVVTVTLYISILADQSQNTSNANMLYYC